MDLESRFPDLWEKFKERPDPVEDIAVALRQAFRAEYDPFGIHPEVMPLEAARRMAKVLWDAVVRWRDKQEIEEVCNEMVR